MEVTKKVLILITLLTLTLQNTSTDEFKSLYNPVYIKEGDNVNFPTKGSSVTVHYTGTFKDGKKFDSSVDRSSPFVFKLGVGQVIQCWDKVVAQMSKGEKIKVTCPSDLAYGSRGAGGIIPPNTDLDFEIELLSWK
jgi:FKBP-type peptidyl-prolyl cis-trans isomerase